MKTEQQIVNIINKYEKLHPHICGTDTLIKFIQWYDTITKEEINNAMDKFNCSL